jgi:SAM-dependent methyltransferase
MNASRTLRSTSLLGLLCLGALPVLGQAQPAQPIPSPYQPTVGQAGKDVVWVPTSDALVEKMLDMAKVTPQDFVIDLGSGDGRTVIAAAKRGVRAKGIEYNPDLVELSKRNAAAAGVSAKASFAHGDIFETDFSDATVITMFLLPSLNMRLRPTLLALKPGTRIVSNSFSMEDWQADETITLSSECGSWCTAMLWIVPAKVDGPWKMPQGQLTLWQRFQTITGTLGEKPIENPRLRGDSIEFSIGETRYAGHVNGKEIQGTTSGASNGRWTATRQ